MPVPPEAYELFAAGEISAQELRDLESFADQLEKSAGIISAEHLPATAAALGGLALAAPTLSYVGQAVPGAMQTALNKMRFEAGLRKTVETSPHLGSTDDPNLRMAYKTLQTTNPEYARDPLIAGTILDMVMSNRMDPNDPSSAPRFDPTLLSEIQKNVTRPADSTAALTAAGSKAILE